MTRSLKEGDLDAVISIIRANNSILQENNRMIYYLCCTVFSRYSFITFDAEKPIACILAFKDSYNTYLWVHQLAVIPEYQGKGIGIKLMKEAFQHLQQEGEELQEIRLAVRESNTNAIRLYERNGFRRIEHNVVIDMLIYSFDLKANINGF